MPPNALIFVLEELDAGHDGYLVAAAARALRSSTPRPEFAPFIIQAVGNMRYRDDAVAFDSLRRIRDVVRRDDSDSRTPRSPSHGWGLSLATSCPGWWSFARPAAACRRSCLPDIDRAVEAIGRGPSNPPGSDCCEWRNSLGSVLRWPFGERADSDAVRSVEFEDHNGTPVTYGEFFAGQPSIVAFFYTRCDNPQKCSLTVAKLARVQRQLVERGIADRVRTAAITYDPGFDLPSRLLAYGRGRQMLMDEGHRLLRATKGIEPLRAYFGLGVNFVESLVNRHRIEIYVLDAAGRIGASFSRIHWDEREVVESRGGDVARRQSRARRGAGDACAASAASHGVHCGGDACIPWCGGVSEVPDLLADIHEYARHLEPSPDSVLALVGSRAVRRDGPECGKHLVALSIERTNGRFPPGRLRSGGDCRREDGLCCRSRRRCSA